MTIRMLFSGPPAIEAAAMALTMWLNLSATNECSLSVSDANLPIRES
jgi:hypothetical protein